MNILPVNPSGIPEAIKSSNRMVNWDAVKRNGKATKVPKNALTGKPASVDNPDSWSDWNTSWKSYESGKHDGIGIVFNGDGLIGIDIDKCREPKTGTILPEVLQYVKELNSFTEVSPSGTGLHIYCKGTLPEGARRIGKIEIYDSGRYFTLTGKHLEGTPKEIKCNQTAIDSFYNRIFKPTPSILEKAFNSKNGAAIKKLYEGNYPHASASEADLALCNQLAYWTNGNASMMDELFRRSALMRPKWDEKRPGGTYGSMTINKALNQQTTSPQEPTRRRKKLKVWSVGNLRKKYDTKVVWLWRTHLAPQEPQMVNGREGSGKTTICLKMAQEMLEENPDKYILWFATEGAVRNTAIKADEMGLATERFIVASKDNDEFLFNFQKQEDINLLDATLEDYNKSVLAVFIDSLRGCSTLDENESQLGKLMIKLNSIVCDRHHAALVYIHHWNKSEKKNYLDRSSGSTAITAAVRHVLSVIPDTKTTRKIVVSKSNIDDQLPELTVIKAGKDILIREINQSVETQKDKSEEFLT